MDLGPHAFFILAAYAATAAILAGLVLRAALDHRAQVRALAELEARGARRRSDVDAGSAAPPPGGPDEPAASKRRRSRPRETAGGRGCACSISCRR